MFFARGGGGIASNRSADNSDVPRVTLSARSAGPPSHTSSDRETERHEAPSGTSTSTAGSPRRSLGRRALVFVSVGAVIGSGWLFSSFDAAQIGGGGGAVTAWILGVSLVLVLAFVHAELGTMFPVDGGTARFPLYAFGRVTGFFSGWFAWISAVCVPAIETEAALRYVGNYAPSLISQSPGVVRLTPLGQLVAVFVLLGFTALNAAGMRWFRETNTIVVWWKIAIPLIVAIAFVVHGFDRHNFAVGGLFPAGAHGVLAAISTGGVVFALLGFEQAVELGGETKNPQRSVPWAVIGSVVIAGAIYLIVQVAFIGAIPHGDLARGWHEVHFHGDFGPLAGLAGVVGLTAFAYLIYADAVISPAGSGMTFSATASRLPFALAREGYLPAWLGTLNRRGVPFRSLSLCYVTQLVVIILLPDWGGLLSFITAATVLVYAHSPARTRGASPDGSGPPPPIPPALRSADRTGSLCHRQPPLDMGRMGDQLPALLGGRLRCAHRGHAGAGSARIPAHRVRMAGGLVDRAVRGGNVRS